MRGKASDSVLGRAGNDQRRCAGQKVPNSLKMIQSSTDTLEYSADVAISVCENEVLNLYVRSQLLPTHAKGRKQPQDDDVHGRLAKYLERGDAIRSAFWGAVKIQSIGEAPARRSLELELRIRTTVSLTFALSLPMNPILEFIIKAIYQWLSRVSQLGDISLRRAEC